MSKKYPSLKDYLLNFPKLSSDINFKIKSPFDQKYNCIAYACNKNDRFWWPQDNIDGVEWPYGLPLNTSIGNFIKLFEKHEYVVCDTHELENDFQKIALYELKGECKHAALQIFNGLWKSKMGMLEDIEHSDPFSIEGPSYGIAKVFMKRSNSSYKIKAANKKSK